MTDAMIEEDDGPTTQPSPPSSAHPCVELAARVDGLDARVSTVETAQQATGARLDAGEKRFAGIESEVKKLNDKTDAQTLILTRIDSAVNALTKTRIGRALLIAVGLALVGWLAKHGIKVEVPQ